METNQNGRNYLSSSRVDEDGWLRRSLHPHKFLPVPDDSDGSTVLGSGNADVFKVQIPVHLVDLKLPEKQGCKCCVLISVKGCIYLK